jgi:hypothetical protein
MSVTFNWICAPFVRWGKNEVLTMATLIARNANEAMVARGMRSGGVSV